MSTKQKPEDKFKAALAKSYPGMSPEMRRGIVGLAIREFITPGELGPREEAPAEGAGERPKPLSKAQIAALRYMARDDYVATPLGNPSVTQHILAERGLCTISEVHGRSGFYATRITDAGLAAIAPTDLEILTDTIPADLLAGEIEALRARTSEPEAGKPVAVTIFCPECALPHIDEGEWATTRQHKTHQCQGCGHEWRPFPFATVGVAHPSPATADKLREALFDLVSWFTKPVQGERGMVWVIPAGERGADDAVAQALATLSPKEVDTSSPG